MKITRMQVQIITIDKVLTFQSIKNHMNLHFITLFYFFFPSYMILRSLKPISKNCI